MDQGSVIANLHYKEKEHFSDRLWQLLSLKTSYQWHT